MDPWYAKVVASALSAGIIALGAYIDNESARIALFTLAGVPLGKEFFRRAGDVSMVTHPDDIK